MVTTGPENRQPISATKERLKGLVLDTLFTGALEVGLYAFNNFYTHTDRPTQTAILATPAVGFLARNTHRFRPIKEDESLTIWRSKNSSSGIPFTLISGLVGVGVGLHENDNQLATHSFVGLAIPSGLGIFFAGANVAHHIGIRLSDTDMRYSKTTHAFQPVNKRILHWT